MITLQKLDLWLTTYSRPANYRYGPWLIYYDPPPIPIRTLDWHFVHDDYDGPGNWRHGNSASPKECIKAIEDLEEMHS